MNRLKPAAFTYLAPTSLSDALALLSEYGDGAKILAGGQSLVPVLNFRMGRYEQLIDLNRIAELSYIRLESETLCIGATTRYRSIEVSDIAARYAPLLVEATHHVAHLPIRTRGTVGGSLSHADPAAEYPAVMLALKADFVIASVAATRRVKADVFFTGPMATVLNGDEVLTEIRIPVRTNTQGFAFEEVSRRKGDFALVGVAAAVTLNSDRIADARIAVCGLESQASRMTEAEHILHGAKPDTQTIARAARAAAEMAAAQNDLHATASYRRHLVSVLTQRALERAVTDAGYSV